MRIAILGIKRLPAVAGADRVVEQLLERFGPDNDYWVFLQRDAARSLPLRPNVHYVRIPALRGKHLGAFSFFLLCALRYVLGPSYDLAHVHNSDFGPFTALLRLRRAPVLATFHGDPYTRAKWGPLARAYLRFAERCFVAFATRLTSVSKFKARARGFFRARRVDYVPNGVDANWREARRADAPPAVPGLEAGAYWLFACGRLDSTKGLHRLLDAYALVPDPKPPLVVVGDFRHDARYSAAIEARIAADDEVHVIRELLPRERLLEALGQCALFVFPSEYEAMSMMLLEAVSCKTPVVCSDIAANLEVVGKDYPYAYPVNDAAELAARLRAASREPAWPAITERLYERALREFSWNKIAERYERLYSALTAAPASRDAPRRASSTSA